MAIASLFAMTQQTRLDPAAANLWHPIAARDDIRPGVAEHSLLLDERIAYGIDAAGAPSIWRSAGAAPLPCLERYGYLWTSLGDPPADIFGIPEFAEPDRRRFNAASVGVHVSAPRAVENFLDMSHFPYVHTGILGDETHTEVKDYDVETSEARDEILATRCRFFQPKSSTAADHGMEVDYIYRVPHPYCAVLYKSSVVDAARQDVIGIFVQPMTQERIRAHMMICVLDDRSTDATIKQFQQVVFGQDKPILENQVPKRLPLDPKAESPVRADKVSIAYRRWLVRKGITYGVIPAAAA
jgi:phenylpropionate dioxygenase-like ring-hydroxylating dioxygenase large terminal subunit